MPELARQPTVAEGSWPPQFQPAQSHLQAVHCVGWNLPVVGEQAHAGVALFLLVEYIQRFAPLGFLLIVDLAQIQNRPLHGLIARQPAILYDAEIAVLLAVPSSGWCCARTSEAAECQISCDLNR